MYVRYDVGVRGVVKGGAVDLQDLVRHLQVSLLRRGACIAVWDTSLLQNEHSKLLQVQTLHWFFSDGKNDKIKLGLKSGQQTKRRKSSLGQISREVPTPPPPFPPLFALSLSFRARGRDGISRFQLLLCGWPADFLLLPSFGRAIRANENPFGGKRREWKSEIDLDRGVVGNGNPLAQKREDMKGRTDSPYSLTFFSLVSTRIITYPPRSTILDAFFHAS